MELLSADTEYLTNGFIKKKLSNCRTAFFEPKRDFYVKRCSKFITENAVAIHSEIKKSLKSGELEWISFITSCVENTNIFAKSLEQNGIKLTVLGLGTVWKQHWGSRLRMLHNYLLHVDPEKIIVWSDADDVLLAPGFDEKEIVARYRILVEKHNGPKIFYSAETACYPEGHLAGKNPESPYNQHIRFLNAGTMVSTAGVLVEYLKYIYGGDCFDDQYLAVHAFLEPLYYWETDKLHVGTASQAKKEKKLLVGLDYDNDLFIAAYGLHDQIVLSEKGLQFDGKMIPIVHQNGDKRTVHTFDEAAKLWIH
ncbi:Multifunctional procollagen lysine hydroxylase and glycosyltransferase LH3 [Boothiomyces macroporosus]|uniref:Multifunctional procollagen lysine hydroxylase and glycosyltransferase LH3 n=1 Tax=Boothiomyces macroporosus TaxID=261099 RepID=A0AAD5UEX6_9FUNG|nr:Multifunctional procollagen lysine hydroxylase and glycosyltransferase LH3 [Boothiomyces macroporosus]